MSVLFVNSILQNPSLCDGYGYRTVLFLQGCDIRCKGCQNQSSWEMEKGSKWDSHELALEIRKRSINKKLTISGGEPLMQKDALIDLLEELKDFDLCLYTGHSKEEVPANIISYLKYLKTGPFIEELKTSTQAFVGSKNQVFETLKK